MAILQNRYIRIFVVLALVGGAATCNGLRESRSAELPQQQEPTEQSQAELKSEQPESTGEADLVADAEPIETVETPVNQGLVTQPGQCLDKAVCVRDWGLQTIGVALQVRADELLRLARDSGSPEIWLTEHLAANQNLLSTETQLLGGVLDGSANQNAIASQRSFEIAATAIALSMHQKAKLPQGEATEVNTLLDFGEALLAEQYAKFPHLTADTREQIEQALPSANGLASQMARSFDE